MDPRNVDAEEGVREETACGESGVGEVDVDDEDREDGEDDPVAEIVETVIGVKGPDYAVGVGVEVGEVLLEDLEV